MWACGQLYRRRLSSLCLLLCSARNRGGFYFKTVSVKHHLVGGASSAPLDGKHELFIEAVSACRWGGAEGALLLPALHSSAATKLGHTVGGSEVGKPIFFTSINPLVLKSFFISFCVGSLELSQVVDWNTSSASHEHENEFAKILLFPGRWYRLLVNSRIYIYNCYAGLLTTNVHKFQRWRCFLCVFQLNDVIRLLMNLETY